MTSTTLETAAPDARCPTCGAPGYRPFFEANGLPAEEGRLCASREEALHMPRGDVRLAFCRACGYIGNTRFDPATFRYDENYSFSLHQSPTYQAFIRDLVSGLIDRHGLRNKTVLEIACGQGEFLSLLCEMGDNRGIGVDPSLKRETRAREESGRIRWIADYYSEQYASLGGDCVCCRHLLHMLPQPRAFVEMVRRAIGDRRETVAYFEVPNGTYVFDQNLVWNIVYERCSWYTPYSIARTFEMCGFEVLSTAACYRNGQYLQIEARPAGPGARAGGADAEELAGLVRSVDRFASHHRAIVDAWSARMASLAGSGLRIAVWGAGAPAISFFNTLKITDQATRVVDINPQVHGHFLPGTGQQVSSPDFLAEYQPDVVLLTNPTYESEIRQQLAGMGLACRVLSIADPEAGL
jgi:SAM-dependent methyltransferase